LTAGGGVLLRPWGLGDAQAVMDAWDGTADVAYWTVPAVRGRGVCPRAVDAMASWAFEVAGLHRLDLEHATANAASCRVAEKTG
jgi:ribosomal-protein-alanine N-acetyltransferase